jgi:hypothetical protein
MPEHTVAYFIIPLGPVTGRTVREEREPPPPSADDDGASTGSPVEVVKARVTECYS